MQAFSQTFSLRLLLGAVLAAAAVAVIAAAEQPGVQAPLALGLFAFSCDPLCSYSTDGLMDFVSYMMRSGELEDGQQWVCLGVYKRVHKVCVGRLKAGVSRPCTC